MAKLVSVFISATHRKAIAVLVWLLCLVTVLALIGSFALHRTGESMRFEARSATGQFARLRANLVSTFDVMHRDLTAEPCSAAFNEQLRKVAYLPDGLNEFLYAPDGRAQCSVSVARLDPVIDLGEPDTRHEGDRPLAFWFDRDLAFLGLEGETGTVALSGPFAAIVPPQRFEIAAPAWLSAEVVLVAQDGSWWHRAGEEGIYAAQREAGAAGDRARLSGTGLYRTFCDGDGMHCLAMRADLDTLMAREAGTLAIALVAAALIAAFGAGQANRLISHYWSFEQRFRRHLDAASVVVAYQPVMALDTGEITGCEVLARWRDVDDRIVFPDRFVGIVERHGLTMRFTEMVAQRACEELSARLPAGRRLQVNFNVFPCDLDSARLAQVFSGFTSQPDRFDVVLEIIESDEIPPNAQREIEALRRLGIKTYIDDFGTGYSNMQNLAALSVDGVKLDRAFAMAPDNSMMAQMLRHAIDMIHATGRVMVVEGVETAERLALLRQMQARIDFVQGYFISRPLDIAAFVTFLTPQPVSLGDRKKKAGLDVVAA